MKILITGATGFLGKQLLERLCDNSSISKILVTSRTAVSHPSPKVQIIPCDLAKPSIPVQLHNISVDYVIHLAAQYSFGTSYEVNYLNNVAATENLLSWLRSKRKQQPRIIFASTYAVGVGIRDSLWSEKPLEKIPPRRQPYARTKHLAEQLILESSFPSTVLRLGILVGDKKTGRIEKIDGPYPMMRLLYFMNKARLLRVTPVLPVVARRNIILPLVPVDNAAEAIEATILREGNLPENEIFGVYNPISISCERFMAEVSREMKIEAKIKFLAELPEFVLNRQEKITHISREMFDYSCAGPSLSNKKYQESFPAHQVPDFTEYKEAFFRGFMEFMGDKRNAGT